MDGLRVAAADLVEVRTEVRQPFSLHAAVTLYSIAMLRCGDEGGRQQAIDLPVGAARAGAPDGADAITWQLTQGHGRRANRCWGGGVIE